MKKIIFRLCALAFLLTLTMPLMAQKASVSVKLIDENTGEPVGYATVSLLLDSKPYKYALTDDKGAASLAGVKNGTYQFKAEMMGLVPIEKEVTVKEGKSIDLGVLKMKIDQQLLDAASVSAVGNPIVVKKDTIEYNASSFKTTENDVLEDLLKKLPGVEVDSEGNITANGQTISKIYIDGKTYFMDDPALASKNLPAKIVDKVKVLKKKSDQAEFTGIDDGQEETVIDLSVQKGMMNGLMGNIRAGVGHDVPAESGSSNFEPYNDTRFTANLFLGNFSEGKQFSVIGNANNGNNIGFGDFSGRMMRGMGGGMRAGSGGGVTTSYLLGGNAGFNLLDDKMELVGDLAYSGTDNDSNKKSYRETYYDDYNQISRTESLSGSSSDGYRFGMRLKHEFSENASIIFEPQVNYGLGSYTTIETFDTDTDDRNGNVQNTNDGFSFNTGDNRNVSASGRLMYRQRLGIPGRTLVLNTDFSYSNNDTDGLNQSLTTNYIGGEARDSIINQRTDQYSRSTSFTARATYTEPLGNDFYAEANYSFTWNRSSSAKNAYDSGLLDGDFTKDDHQFVESGSKFNPVFSNSITNKNINQRVGANLMYRRDKLMAQVGLSVNPSRVSNYTERASYVIDTTYSVLNWSPQAMLFYDLNDNTNFRFRYRGNTSQPSVTQLVPVLDNSNPISQSLGNPYLLPYFSHNFGGEARYSNPKDFSAISVRVDGGFVKNPIINATWTTRETGKTFTMPVNGPTSANFSAAMFGNLPIAKSNFSISNMTRFSMSKSASYVGNNVETDKYYKDNDFDYVAFRQDYSDMDSSKEFERNDTRTMNVMERFHLTYRNDALEIRVGGGTNYSRARYSIYSDQNINTWRNSADASFIWTWNLTGMSLRSDVNYRWYRGYTSDMSDETILNAEISKLVFKKKATVSLNIYDILGQSRSLSVSDTSNYHSESLSNTVGRYVMLSLTWRFGSFGGRRDGRGPMGPPPGGFRGGFPGGGRRF